MKLWIVAAADDASLANLPKSLTNPLSEELLRRHGISLVGDVRAWGAKNGDSNVTNVLSRMQAGDLCVFYTKSPSRPAPSYTWAARVTTTVQSKALSQEIWGTDAFELIYFLGPAKAIDCEKNKINEALGYTGDYFPRGLMRPKASPDQIAQVGRLIGMETDIENDPQPPVNVPAPSIQPLTTPMEITRHISEYCRSCGFWFPPSALRRFYAAIRSKPFTILAGNSGTGKSRLVRLFAEAIGATVENGRFTMIPVRPDWNDSSELLGYFDLNGDYIPGQLIAPLILANDQPTKPFFVCLDEMNLARVEHYFSDFLSIIESRRTVEAKIVTDAILRVPQLSKLKTEGLNSEVRAALTRQRANSQSLGLPENLFIVGTVNMDETTQPFSRKVLDRANTIEFNDIDLLQGLDDMAEIAEVQPLDLDQSFIQPQFASLRDLLPHYRDRATDIANMITNLNSDLAMGGFEVGYRVRDEATAFAVYASEAGLSDDEVNESIVLQKILPRIQGSSPRVEKLLMALLKKLRGESDVPDSSDPDLDQKLIALHVNDESSAVVRKIAGMAALFREENFTSFWLV